VRRVFLVQRRGLTVHCGRLLMQFGGVKMSRPSSTVSVENTLRLAGLHPDA
jgi:hypothetical protein